MRLRAAAPRQSGSLAGKLIVVVGINYAPETTGIAPYTTDLCEFLASQGASVTALVGLPHYPAWSVPDEYKNGRRADELINGVRVLRSGHFVPRRQTAARRGLYEASFMVRSRHASRDLRADAVLAVTPSLSSVRTGEVVARRNSAPLGVVVQDLMGKASIQSGMEGGARVARLVTRAETAILGRADQVAVISSAFANALVGCGIPADRIWALPNHSHIRTTTATRNDARIELGWDRDEFVVLHTGNMGLKQDLGNVVAAARLAAESKLRLTFVLMGDGSQRRRLQSLAADLGNVRFVRPVEQEKYPIALAAADVLLVNERITAVDMSLPSKLTSYFTSGRPVVAAVPAEGATARELRRSKASLLVEPDQPARLVEAVVLLREQAQMRRELGANGVDYATARLGVDAAHGRALEFVSQLLGLPRAPAVLGAPLVVQRLRPAPVQEFYVGPGPA